MKETLNKFDPITLQEMDCVTLLNRADTKYLLNREKIFSILEQLIPYYRILEIDSKRTNDYKTLYFDTEDFKLYNDHQRGKLNRQKIRYRKYMDSNLCYLEIKLKTNKGKTEKERIKRKDFEDEFSEKSKKFIEETSPIPVNDLNLKIINRFTRITLVHKQKKERVTFDFDLNFHNEIFEQALPGLVIAELKQEKFSSLSDFISVMKKERIYPSGFSKYCIGSVLLYPHLKRNAFKSKLLMLNKITHGNIAA